MKKRRLPNNLISNAGVHFVVSELSRRGLIALPTVKNTAAYDIIVANQKGTKHANLQVKTSFGTRKFWPMPSSKKIRTGPDDYYIYLRWLRKEDRFQGYMLTGREARKGVRKGERIIKAKGQKAFPVLYIKRDGKSNPWAINWAAWNL